MPERQDAITDDWLGRLQTEQPRAFRDKLDAFKGDRIRLHAGTLAQAREETDGLRRVHYGLLLLCLGDAAGAELLLEGLRGGDEWPRRYALQQMNLLWRHARSAELPIAPDPLAAAVIPLLHAQDPEERQWATEFFIHHLSRHALSSARSLLQQADAEARFLVAAAYIGQGLDEGALAAAEEHFLAPLPEEAGALRKWRHNSQYLADALFNYFRSAPEGVGKSRVLDAVMRSLQRSAHSADSGIRTWFTEDHRGGHSYCRRLIEIVHHASTAQGRALLREVASSGAAPYCRALAACHAAAAPAVPVPGAIEALEAMARDHRVGEYARAPVLEEFTRLFGTAVVPALCLALQDANLRDAATRCVAMLPRGPHDARLRGALHGALQTEQRDWIAGNLAGALAALGEIDPQVLQQMQPWEAMALRWQQEGLTLAEAARQLREAGLIDPPAANATAPAAGQPLDGALLGLFGERLVFGQTSGGHEYADTIQHDGLVRALAAVVRPPLELEDLAESWPDNAADIRSAGVCTVRWRHHGRSFRFSAAPEGSYVDIPAVLKAFNGFMSVIGRKERAFRFIEEPGSNGEWSFFVCGDPSRVAEMTAKLHLPLQPAQPG